MDFTIDDEQKALQDAARELAARYGPQSAPGAHPVGPQPHDAKTWTALCELGALGLPFPEEVGGLGASPVEVMLLAGELGRGRVQTAYADALLAISMLTASGSHASLVESAVEGSALVLPALAEPGAAWSIDSSSVTASQEGDTWRLTGLKSPVLALEAATHVIVPAQTLDGLAAFLVEAPGATAGVALEMDGVEAELLLTPGAARAALHRGANLAIVALAGEALGAMESALSSTVDYLKTRKQFGVPLMTFQTLTQRAADMYVSLELARSTIYYGAMQLTEQPDDTATASRVKVITGQAGRHIGQEAIQLHGGIAMTAEYAVGHLTSRLAAIEHTFGDTREHLGALARRVGDHDMLDVL